MVGEVPFCLKRTATDLPGLIRPVSKAPSRVAVWVTWLELEKVTLSPLAIFSVAGLKAKLTMST